MSSSAMKWARRQQIQDATLFSVVKRLAEVADDAGVSWASQARLAHDCGMSDRSVRRALQLLQLLGVIARTRRSRGSSGRTTDFVALALHRDFDIGRALVRKLRSAARSRPQPDNVSVATGQCVQGIMKGTTYPIQEGEITYQGKALGTGRPHLTLISGTSTNEEDAA